MAEVETRSAPDRIFGPINARLSRQSVRRRTGIRRAGKLRVTAVTNWGLTSLDEQNSGGWRSQSRTIRSSQPSVVTRRERTEFKLMKNLQSGGLGAGSVRWRHLCAKCRTISFLIQNAPSILNGRLREKLYNKKAFAIIVGIMNYYCKAILTYILLACVFS